MKAWLLSWPRLALLAVVLLALWPSAPRAGERRRPSLGQRLLGPIAGLVASTNWMRFDVALRDGEPLAAYAVAQRALEWDPEPWQGWSNLGLHLIFDRGSAELEPDPALRRGWIRSGLEVLQRGARAARHPEELDLLRGLVLASHVAPRAKELGWPGGALAAVQASQTAFQSAAAAGHPSAAQLLDEAFQLEATLAAGGWPESWR